MAGAREATLLLENRGMRHGGVNRVMENAVNARLKPTALARSL
jgi:hypothetical protein